MKILEKLSSVNWLLVAVIFVFISVVVIMVMIYSLFKKNKLSDVSSVMINPIKVPSKRSCKKIRTPCDPKDPMACENSCDDSDPLAQMKCIVLDDINPQGGSGINGGGAVCLPGNPGENIHCNTKNGGVYVWTGWGFTDNQDWDCYCMYPEYFGGPGCEKINSDVCSGGNVDLGRMIGEPTSDICKCPEGTELLLRAGAGTPYCESTDERKGGGMFGLAGGLHSSPDWRNVLFRQYGDNDTRVPEDIDVWAGKIVREVTASYDPGKMAGMVDQVKDLLGGLDKSCVNCSFNDPCADYCTGKYFSNIGRDTANKICKIICPNACGDICNCSDGSAVWSDMIEKEGEKMWYTYDLDDFPPSGYCTPTPIQYYCSNNCVGTSSCPVGSKCYQSKDECKIGCKL